MTAVPLFRPLQLLLATSLRPLRLLFPDFNSSPIVCASAAASRLHPLLLLLPDCIHLTLTCSGKFQLMPDVLEHSLWSLRFSKLKYEGRTHVSSLVPPHEHPTSVTHTPTHINIIYRGATALLVAAMQPRLRLAIAQAKYCNSFQLTHMPCGNHAQSRSRAMATKRKTRHYYSTHNLASTVSFGM